MQCGTEESSRVTVPVPVHGNKRIVAGDASGPYYKLPLRTRRDGTGLDWTALHCTLTERLHRTSMIIMRGCESVGECWVGCGKRNAGQNEEIGATVLLLVLASKQCSAQWRGLSRRRRR